MAVCSFMGHEDVYDVNIESRLQLAVDQIVANHESVEFLIYQRGKFYELCLLTALKAKTCQPQKVTITLVVHKDGAHYVSAPDCMIDKTVVLCFERPKKDAVYILHKKALRWLIQNSTHVITCVYGQLYDPYNRLPQRLPMLEVISLESPEIETAILEIVPSLTEKEQTIYQKISEGYMLKEAGQVLGVSHERARQILAQGSETIRKHLRRRYLQALTPEQRRKKRTCGLFAMGESLHEPTDCLKSVIDFLVSTYKVSDIYVEQAYVQSDFMAVLDISQQKLHITAMVNGKPLTENDDSLDELMLLLRPPCHAVGCISWADSKSMADGFGVVADMIERMDFCICDLSAASNAKKIRKYATQAKHTILLDIGGANAKADG